MNKWVIGGLVVAVLGAAFVGFYMTTKTSTPSSSVEEKAVIATDTAVAIKNSAFTPATITIKKGVTVTWTNEDSMGHNVVSDNDAPDGGPAKEAGLLSQGQTFSHTFSTVGTFPYHCTPHPFMKGTVEVVE